MSRILSPSEVRIATAAPTAEIGHVTAVTATRLRGILGTLNQLEDREYNPDLLDRQRRAKLYEQMLNDARLDALYAATILTVSRFGYVIDPQDAKPEVVEALQSDLSLPLKGQEDFKPGRRKGRFSFAGHRDEALDALAYGHYFFEQVGEIGPDGLWHIRKLAPRPPWTLTDIRVADDGGLESVIQSAGIEAKEIPVHRLVGYVWRKRGANWSGRSILRSCVGNWTCKWDVLSADVLNVERNGVGTPIIEAPEGATKAEIEALGQMAQEFRGGPAAGGAIPHGADLNLKGVQGSQPDGIASARFHNEEMAAAFLSMFMQLGQTETGSRALGSEFIDLFTASREVIADWFLDTFNEHVVEDWVDWNFGPDENAPRVVWEHVEDSSLALSDLMQAVQAGLVPNTPELQAYISRRYQLPEAEEPEAPEPPEAAPPNPPPSAGRSDGRERRRTQVSASTSLSLPDRELRRQPYEQEVAAKVDYQLMDAQLQGLIDRLVASVKGLQSQQIDELAAQVEAASGDLDALSKLQATPAFAAVIEETMQTMAAQGMDQALGEAQRQGIQPKIPELDTSSLTARAGAVDTLLTRSLSETAGRKAVNLTGGEALSAADVAKQTAAHLRGLSEAYLQDQLGGALVQALNTGRKAVMAANPYKEIFASELLDDAGCDACLEIDGTVFATLAEAEESYPTGGYADCAGGPRCRGTLVATFASETDPSVE